MSQNAKTQRDSVGKMALLGVQHVFAMFGATVLVPALTGLSPTMALLCAGIGTWIFHLVTGRKVPVFLGSSFAFIGAIIGAAQICSGGAEFGSQAYLDALPYATGGIVVAGALYLVLAGLVMLFGAQNIRKFFPPIVTGPIIIVIGLMLAPTAISSITSTMQIGESSVRAWTVSAGFVQMVEVNGAMVGQVSNTWINWGLAALTVAAVVVTTLFAKGLFKLVPILIGIVVGYVVSLCLGLVNFQPVVEAQWFALPNFMLPKFDWRAIGLVAPIAIVTFVEHIGDISASSAVVGKDFIEDPGLHRTLIGDGLATMVAGAIGGPANTTYSENTGVLAATKNYNPLTLEIAACVAIVLAFLGKLGAVLQTLPGPVMGGVSVVLFGMIAAVGFRTLVENKVDFTKSRNLLIVAIMIVLGLGADSALVIGGVAVSGVALAAVVGIVLNKLLPENIEA